MLVEDRPMNVYICPLLAACYMTRACRWEEKRFYSAHIWTCNLIWANLHVLSRNLFSLNGLSLTSFRANLISESFKTSSNAWIEDHITFTVCCFFYCFFSIASFLYAIWVCILQKLNFSAMWSGGAFEQGRGTKIYQIRFKDLQSCRCPFCSVVGIWSCKMLCTEAIYIYANFQ